jgi:hypothetical protein
MLCLLLLYLYITNNDCHCQCQLTLFILMVTCSNNLHYLQVTSDSCFVSDCTQYSVVASQTHVSSINRKVDYPLDSAPSKVVPNISRPKKSRHFRMKLPDNFQMREHSRPCRFHIIFMQIMH